MGQLNPDDPPLWFEVVSYAVACGLVCGFVAVSYVGCVYLTVRLVKLFW